MKQLLFSVLVFFLLWTNTSNAQETLYTSETLQIEQISPNTFVHISYLNTNDFGKVACNGMIVINEGEALVFDTPASNEASVELINWLEKAQKAKVKGVVATHFHWDCVGGLTEFHSKGIPSFASNKTIELAKAAGYPTPENGFKKGLISKLETLKLLINF